MTDRPATAYWDYIRIEDLLALQGGLDDDESKLENEEVLFITVHQIFELWFKLALKDLTKARNLFSNDSVAEEDLAGVVSRLKRATTIFRVAVHHWEVMETLQTRDFLSFRDKLMPASGFQSAQMRQLEILLGLEESERVQLGGEDNHLDTLKNADGSESPSMLRVKAQLADKPTLKEAVTSWLYRTPIDGIAHDQPDAEEKLGEFLEAFLQAHANEVESTCGRAKALVETDSQKERLERIYLKEIDSVRKFFQPSAEEGGTSSARARAAMLFIETYRDLPLLAWPREVLAALIELEQSIVVFRGRHARMVERIIGRRTGTGGSLGVDYLDETARKYRIFRDLWAIRTLLLKPGAAPALRNPDFYGFKN